MHFHHANSQREIEFWFCISSALKTLFFSFVFIYLFLCFLLFFSCPELHASRRHRGPCPVAEAGALADDIWVVDAGKEKKKYEKSERKRTIGSCPAFSVPQHPLIQSEPARNAWDLCRIMCRKPVFCCAFFFPLFFFVLLFLPMNSLNHVLVLAFPCPALCPVPRASMNTPCVLRVGVLCEGTKQTRCNNTGT